MAEDADIIVTNEEISITAQVLPITTGRKNRDGVVVFQLARLSTTVSPIVEAYQHARRECGLMFAQKDGRGDVVFVRNGEGEETEQIVIDPRTGREYVAEMNRLARKRSRIVGFEKISAQALLDGWKTMDQETGKEHDEGVEPAIIMGLTPFLNLDIAALVPAEALEVIPMDDE
jgi:hypothetical protein